MGTSMPAATLKIIFSIPSKVSNSECFQMRRRNAFEAKTWRMRQRTGQCPKLVPERAATSLSERIGCSSCQDGLGTCENRFASVTRYYWLFCAPLRKPNDFT
eukprot:528408-Pleurochrysis_carterae.AAC.1